MAIYTNQTAEELEELRCTSEGIFYSQNSVWMKINFVMTYTIIAMTFFMSIKAAKILKCHNVYSDGTHIILTFMLLNANVNQAVFLEIRIRHLFHVLINSNDPCQIEFHSPECTYDQTPFSFTTTLSADLVYALTCDRFLAFCVPSFYAQKSKLIALLLVALSIILAVTVHLGIYSGVSRAGYVPSCQYPPQLALDSYQEVSNVFMAFSMLSCFMTIAILLMNMYKDRKIRQSVYDSKARYASFENLVTTKAICSITSTQFLLMIITSAAVLTIRSFEAGLSEDVFHVIVQYVGATMYGNLSIPTLIYLQTNKCIQQRRKSIGKMTKQIDHVDTHISSLRKMWE